MGEIDTTALIISICVVVPSVIAIGICVIIYCSHRNQDQKLNRQINRSTLYEYEFPRERQSREAYIIDFSRTSRSQPQSRRREPPPIFEQSPPAYDTTIIPTRRQPPTFYLPLRNGARQSPSTITTSVYSAMPPSYAEIFLTPQTLSNE
ncbi:unnamed protein product [Adineta ricciae]|uniref:Uncharacterized protein n=1 Tax=Adineta ricciae TaxID=249248 RepID=A0A816H7E0_ADIRI|nr:unnamed protein product [Adineta ricciae]